MPDETAEEIATGMETEVDPDGEGPLPPIKVKFQIPEDKKVYAGIVIGFIMATVVHLGIGMLT